RVAAVSARRPVEGDHRLLDVEDAHPATLGEWPMCMGRVSSNRGINMSRISKWAVAALVLLAAAAAASGIALSPEGRSLAGLVLSGPGPAQAATGVAGGAPPPVVPGAPAGRSAPTPSDGPHIVVFREPALGAYRGEISGLAEPRRMQGPRGKARLDRGSLEARRYVGYLRDRQAPFEREISARIGRPLAVETRMQHAVNGIIAELTVAEADRVRALPEVLFVEEYREYELDTDTGPALIGAPAVWDGSNPGAMAGYQGEGMVFGILDSGINFGNPSFAAVDPVDGYEHANPLGDGNYLGTCAAGGRPGALQRQADRRLQLRLRAAGQPVRTAQYPRGAGLWRQQRPRHACGRHGGRQPRGHRAPRPAAAHPRRRAARPHRRGRRQAHRHPG